MRSFSFFVCHFRFGSPLNGCMGLVALSVVSVWNPPSYVLVLGVTYFPPRTPPPPPPIRMFVHITAVRLQPRGRRCPSVPLLCSVSM